MTPPSAPQGAPHPAAAHPAAAQLSAAQPAAGHLPGSQVPVTLTVNGEAHTLTLDPRVSLLDTLREHLHLTGTKKGCDHGQCGACTVLVDGTRLLSCLTLAVMHGGQEVTTVEGLGTPDDLHPLQDAFIRHDGYQCGYCTPGQLCSSVGALDEIARGVPSHVTADLDRVSFSAGELRERLSGNLCRCAAYPNIIAAVSEVHAAQNGAATQEAAQ